MEVAGAGVASGRVCEVKWLGWGREDYELPLVCSTWSLLHILVLSCYFVDIDFISCFSSIFVMEYNYNDA